MDEGREEVPVIIWNVQKFYMLFIYFELETFVLKHFHALFCLERRNVRIFFWAKLKFGEGMLIVIKWEF